MDWTSWCHCSNETSVFPCVALPLKVFIWGVPRCSPVANVFIKFPMSSPGWAGTGGVGIEEVVLQAPTLYLVVQGQEVKMLLWVNPPSQKGDLLFIHIRIPISHRISPRCLWWGAFSSQSVISLQSSSMSCCNSLSASPPRFAWRCCRVLPPGWGLPGGKWGSSSPSESKGWALDGSPVTAAI